MSVTLFCDESKYSWDKNKTGSRYRYFCIAGIIVPSESDNEFTRELIAFKSKFFGAFDNPQDIEIKGREYAGKKGPFSQFSDEDMQSFRQELSHLIFRKLAVKVLALCNTESSFETPEKKHLSDQLKLGMYELASLFFFVRYNTYLADNHLNGHIVFDEGNKNVLRLLSWLKQGEGEMAFDLSKRISIHQNTKGFFDDSKQNHMLQVADTCAYTIAFFHAMTHTENGTLPAIRANRLLEVTCPLDIPELMDACIDGPSTVSNVIRLYPADAVR